MYALVLSENIFTASFLSRGLKYENIQSESFSFHNFDPDFINMRNFDCVLIKVEDQTGEKLEPVYHILNYMEGKPLYIIKPGHIKIPVESKNVIVTNNGTSIRQIAYDMKKRINGSATKIKDSIIKVADMILDLQKRSVSRFGEKHTLRNKEFHLLEFLMRNTEIIFSRQKILEQVWDRNTNMFTNTVDVHINLLRKKLDHKEGFRLIETVHCNGYIMHSEPFS